MPVAIRHGLTKLDLTDDAALAKSPEFIDAAQDALVSGHFARQWQADAPYVHALRAVPRSHPAPPVSANAVIPASAGHVPPDEELYQVFRATEDKAVSFQARRGGVQGPALTCVVSRWMVNRDVSGIVQVNADLTLQCLHCWKGHEVPFCMVEEDAGV